jgi:hypothetical protein
VIFRPDVARLILRGGKTATRVPVKPGEGRPPFRIGHSYAVQPGPGRAALARVVVLEAEHELLGDVGFEQARAEGHRTTDDFKVAWVRQHDRAWLRRQEPDPPADGSDPEPVPDELLIERFDRRHADRPVWAIGFQLDTSHRPRFMHRLSERGYTANERDAVPEEPEAVDAATQERFAAEARERDPVRRGWLDQQQLDERRGLEQQLSRARELARRRGIDVRNDVRVIERRIASIVRKATRQDAA